MKAFVYVIAVALLVGASALPTADDFAPEESLYDLPWDNDDAGQYDDEDLSLDPHKWDHDQVKNTRATVMMEEEEEQALVESEAKPTGELNVLENLIKLKAYCLAAWDDARTLMNQNSGKYGAILKFVTMYGQEGGGVDRGGRKGHVENIVSEYADLVATMKRTYGRGINSYVLDNLDHHIRTDPNGVVFQTKPLEAFGNGGDNGRKFGRLLALRTKALGLTERPHIVVELAARYAEYLHFKTVAAKEANNADAVAASLFFKRKAAGRYKSFLQREIAQVHRRMKQEFQFTAKSAYVAENTAFKVAYEKDRQAFFKHLQVQAKAGRDAAKKTAKTLPWTPPTMDEMVAIAKTRRDKFMKEFKEKKDIGSVIKDIVNEAGGVKLFITTSTKTGAQSTMKPEVTFIGKTKSVKGRVRAVPGKGNTFVQHFKVEGEPLKDLKKVVLTAPPGDQKWSCDHAKVRVGGKDGKIISLLTSGEKPPQLVPEGAQELKGSFELDQVRWGAAKKAFNVVKKAATNVANKVKQGVETAKKRISEVNPLGKVEAPKNKGTPNLRNGMVMAFRSDRGGKYCSDTGSKIECNRNKAQSWEHFTLHKDGDRWGLKSGHSGKWCSDAGDHVVCNRDKMQGWERFAIAQSGSQLTFKGGRSNKYCTNDWGAIRCNRDKASGWEHYHFNCVSNCYPPPPPNAPPPRPVIPKTPVSGHRGFWLEGGNSIVLVPDKAELGRNEYEKAQCMGWKATQECDGKGKRDSESDKGCTDKIDGSMSGYCQCDTGRLATVDCGHDEFTCEEICMT